MIEILSPTLPDLAIRVNADYEEMGRTIGLRVVGNFFVPILSGLVYDRFPRSKDVLFGIIFILAGISEIAVPYCSTIWILTTVLVFQGVSDAVLVIAAQSTIIELFGNHATSVLQFMHLGWGLGAFLVSLIVRPFLAANLKLSNGKVRYACLEGAPNISTTNSSSILPDATGIEGSRIENAFLIVGSYTILIGIILFFFSLLPKPVRLCDEDGNKKKNVKEMLAPGRISEGKPLFGTIMLVGLFVIFVLDDGANVAFVRYLVTIAIDPCKGFQMTQKRATLLQSIVALCISFSRIVSGILFALLIARDKSPGIVIVSCCCGMTVSIVLLSIFGLKYEVAFWILSCTFEFFHSPLFGGNTPWFNQYIEVTSSVVAVAVTGSNFGKFFFAWLCGYFLKTQSSQYLLNRTIPIVVALLITVAICFIASLHFGRRPSLKRCKVESEMEEELQNVAEKELETNNEAKNDL